MHEEALALHRPAANTARASPPRYNGEPLIPAGATAPAAARAVAVSFVRDYAHWNNGRRSTIPARDATVRVIELIEHQPRGTPVSVAEVVHSVRIGTAGPDRYVVTSAMGNFPIGSAGDRWLVVSLPGD